MDKLLLTDFINEDQTTLALIILRKWWLSYSGNITRQTEIQN